MLATECLSFHATKLQWNKNRENINLLITANWMVSYLDGFRKWFHFEQFLGLPFVCFQRFFDPIIAENPETTDDTSHQIECASILQWDDMGRLLTHDIFDCEFAQFCNGLTYGEMELMQSLNFPIIYRISTCGTWRQWCSLLCINACVWGRIIVY